MILSTGAVPPQKGVADTSLLLGIIRCLGLLIGRLGLQEQQYTQAGGHKGVCADVAVVQSSGTKLRPHACAWGGQLAVTEADCRCAEQDARACA